MKRIITGAMAMIATACAMAAGAPVEVERGKVAVVYFSWSPDGNTRFAAETIARKAEADLFEIKPTTPYNPNYRACCDEANPECFGKKLRPIMPMLNFKAEKYDVIFVGTPNWWGTMAPPVRTWVTTNKSALKGKTVAIFQTHGGGGMQRVGAEFAEILPSSAKVLEPKAFSGHTIRAAKTALEAFVTDRIRFVVKKK